MPPTQVKSRNPNPNSNPNPNPGKEGQELETEEEADAFIATQDLQIRAITCLMSLLDGTTAEEVSEKMLPNIQVHDMVVGVLSAR